MKRLTFLTLLAFASVSARAHTIQTADAVKAIIGEAGGESYAAQVAVASAIRHRGSLQGVFGLTNPLVNHATSSQKRRAARAWRYSAAHDACPGCRYFGCDADAPYFAAIGLKPVMKLGGITFYR